MKEDRRHRSHELNPRRWPKGPEHYDNASKEKIWESIRGEVLLSLPEQKFLQDVPRHLGEGDYANLGHAKGGSAILLASGLRENCLSGKVHSVDLRWRPGSSALLESVGLRDRVEKCEGSTDEWAEKFDDEDRTFNFVFIDADHCYEAVVRDFWNWEKFVRVGGWISFHDTNQDFSHKAIDDTVSKHSAWRELKEFHVHRIRTFERID